MNKHAWISRTALALLLASSPAAWGQTFSSGSTGADGALTHTSGTANITVRPGGVYHYTTVNISAGTFRYFKNTDNAPLVILATGDVNISGLLEVNGRNGMPANSVGGPRIGGGGGPGGFSGGNGGHFGFANAAAGQGPGGGAPFLGGVPAAGGTYGAPTSFVALTPLFGGSGGGGGLSQGGNVFGGSGAGGGGAVLIASSTRIIINGEIRANGGPSFVNTCNGAGSPGSGGAIRLVAPEILGSGHLSAIPGTGGCTGSTPASVGRIRLEAFASSGFLVTTNPVPSVANAPGPVSPAGNPALANVPTLAIASVGGIPVPSTPVASYFSPDMALAPGTPNPIPVVVSATNIPVGVPTEITLRVIPTGTSTNLLIPTTDHTGTFASSTATANVTLPAGQVTVLQAHAAMTLTGQTASLFPLIDGEPVERVMVAATPGEPSTLSLVTRSGREVPLDDLPAEDRLRVALAWETMRSTRAE